MPAVVMQDILNLARLSVNDDSTARYSDSSGLKYANDAIARTYELRPDLRYGAYGTTATDLVTTSSFPLPLEYRSKVANYVVWGWQSNDDQYVNDNRAAQSRKAFFDSLFGAG